MAQRNELKFSKDGKPKIVQLTSVHFKYGSWTSDIALGRINQVFDDKRPDLAIFIGDVVHFAPVDSGTLQILEPVAKCKLSLVVTFGNRDSEQGIAREQLYDIVRQVPGDLLPDCGTVLSPDYVLTVKPPSNLKKDVVLLYYMNFYSYSPLKDVKGYAWFTFGQIDWHH